MDYVEKKGINLQCNQFKAADLQEAFEAGQKTLIADKHSEHARMIYTEGRITGRVQTATEIANEAHIRALHEFEAWVSREYLPE
jgi:hypothetical protein